MLAAALRGDSAPWPTDAGEDFEAALVATAREHGVAALVTLTTALHSWPGRVQRAFRDVRRYEAVIEEIRRRSLREVVEAFRAAGIQCLLIKGAQLGYTHYSEAWLRPRSDADLLIDAADREHAAATLRDLGYAASTQISGTLVAHQATFERGDDYGLIDAIDLHWKLTNPHVFADAFRFDELMREARPIPQLGAAMGLSTVHALLVACMHRVAHHQNSDLLIWLYDIHLLANAMNDLERQEFLELARRKRLRAICKAGLEHAQRRFGTTYPSGLLNGLAVGPDEIEPSSAFLQSGVRRVDMLVWDLRAIGGWSRKARLLRETVFPPVAYVRARYGPDTPLLLAYLDRVVSGARKWFRPS